MAISGTSASRMDVETYRFSARLIHWTMAGLIVLMTVAGIVMTQQGLSRDLQNTLFIFHKNVGVLMIALVIVRIAIRIVHKPPAEPAHLPVWQARVASATHYLLYGLMIIMPISGYIRVKAGGFPIETLDAAGIPALVARSDAMAAFAKSVHFYSGRLLILLMAMHIGAALFHAIVKRDGVFQRMWPSRQHS